MKRLIATLGFSALAGSALAAGSDTIKEHDPFGIYLAILSIIVVVVALVVLWLLIDRFGKFMVRSERKRTQAAKRRSEAVAAQEIPSEINGEIIAAIMLVLKMDSDERHDLESEVITFNKMVRVYSPWSSKIHGLTQIPR